MVPKFQSRWIAVGVALVLTVGCADPFDDEGPPAPVEQSRVVVEQQLPRLDEVMVDAARRQAVREAIADIVEKEAQRPFMRRVEDGLRYSTVFDREYVQPSEASVFVDQWGLTAQGERLLEVIQEADRHGLEVETLHRERIADGLAALVDGSGDNSANDTFSPTGQEVEALVELVADATADGDDVDGVGVLVDVVSTVGDDDEVPEKLQRFRDYNLTEAERFADRAYQIAWLELLLADAALRYARKMRHANLKRVDQGRLAREGSTEIILGRMQKTLTELHSAEGDEIFEVMQRLEPSHPQYRALLAATDRYRQFVDDGGWSWVPSFRVEKGAASHRVVLLRDRLEAEGFDARPDEPDDDYEDRVVDETLIEGIRQYQQTHQFVDDGEPTPGFWRSLNISAERRLEQMELTLQRWRNSHIEDDEDFIMVNIPLFKAQVWVDGDEQMEFSVVVGNNNRRCDAETEKWEYPDATPVMMAEMDHMIFNPYWYVPDRIVQQTLMPRLEENEDYFEEEGYEMVELAEGNEVVRQLPGENNALGRVKFMFPNNNSIYLHDTPDPQFFDYGIRAFSHGCVRVSEPIELAEYLLDLVDRDDLDVQEIVNYDDLEEDERPRQRYVEFDREMPVFIEYYTVWVDDQGRPNFLADIYDKDEYELAEDPDEFWECEPELLDDDEEDEKREADDGEDEEEPEDLDDDVGP